MTPAWAVGAWPPVLWQPVREPIPHFVHLGTHTAPLPGGDWPRMGQTVWGGRAADRAAGISWDWIEVGGGVLAVADPMMLITNLRVLGADGEVLTAYESAPYLNRIVARLPWQAEVLALLGPSDAAPSPWRLPVPVQPPPAARRRDARSSDFAPLA